MNFLDAHKIVHQFSEAVGTGIINKNDLGFRPISLLPFEFDKNRIFEAHQLFFAHMVLYKTRTLEEYNRYKFVFMTIDKFIPDEELLKIRLASQIAEKKGFINKIIYGKKIDDATQIVKSVISKYGDSLPEICSMIDDLMNYVNIMQDYCTKEIGNIYDYWSNPNDTYDNLAKKYVKEAYQLANIEYRSEYYHFFQPFAYLRGVLASSNEEDKSYKDYYNGYENYINSMK